jgi:hypothetical protein
MRTLPMLRPVRTVTVTSKEELDAALASADQITVEGDDELLTYAVNEAAGDPGNRVVVETEEIAADKGVTRGWINQRPLPAAAAPKLGRRLTRAFAGLAVRVLGGVWFLSRYAAHFTPATPPRPIHPPPPPPPDFPPQPTPH